MSQRQPATSSRSKQQTVGETTNPHIVQCLEEFEEQAKKRKQDKLSFTFRKALRSVQKYPLPLNNGQECRVLEGVGPVLAAKIDKWLQKKGLFKETPEDTVPSPKQSTSTAPSSSASPSPQKKQRKARRYMPKFRSAAWALLIALYRNSKSKGSGSASDPTKQELISLSSHLSDTSMLPASAGGNNRKNFKYCGWTSMKSSLLERKLVSKRRGRPQKFFLTEGGRRLARKLHLGAIQLLNEDPNSFDPATSDDEIEPDPSESSDSEDLDTRPSKNKKSKPAPKRTKKKPTQTSNTAAVTSDSQTDSQIDIMEVNSEDDYETMEIVTTQQSSPAKSYSSAPDLRLSYLNAMFQSIESKDQAQVQIHHDLGLVFLCQMLIPNKFKFDNKQLEKYIIVANAKESMVILDVELTERRKQYGVPDGYYQVLLWMCDEVCGDFSTLLFDQLFSNKRSLRNFSEDLKPKSPVTNPITSKMHSSASQQSTAVSEQPPASAPTATASPATKKTTNSSPSAKPKTRKRKRSEEDIDTPSGDQEGTICFLNSAKNPPEPISKRARQNKFSDDYKLVVVVDQRERLSNDRNYIVQRLGEAGVSVESHQLGLGDFIWVARSKKDANTEYLLNIVVERKAIDDLAGSIIDGRYKEQRFRLSQLINNQQQAGCSLLQVIYLIEGEFARQNRLPVKNLQNSLVRLQISDQFTVKHTSSIAQSIEYIVAMTRVLTELLDTKGLDAYKMTLCDDEVFVPNLRQYSLYAAKSGSHTRLTPQDIFARQLCCIHGISPPIAESIVESYPSARSLVDKMESEDGVTDVAKIEIPVARFKGVVSRRIGPSLAKVLHSLYSDQS